MEKPAHGFAYRIHSLWGKIVPLNCHMNNEVYCWNYDFQKLQQLKPWPNQLYQSVPRNLKYGGISRKENIAKADHAWDQAQKAFRIKIRVQIELGSDQWQMGYKTLDDFMPPLATAVKIGTILENATFSSRDREERKWLLKTAKAKKSTTDIYRSRTQQMLILPRIHMCQSVKLWSYIFLGWQRNLCSWNTTS